jgi:hypothetical protein
LNESGFAWDPQSADEYLGVAVSFDAANRCTLVQVSDFRGPGKEKETWTFILDHSSDHGTRRVVFDVRSAIYPNVGPILKETFQELARTLPRSKIGIISDGRQPDVVALAGAAAREFGHDSFVSTDECAVLRWINGA